MILEFRIEGVVDTNLGVKLVFKTTRRDEATLSVSVHQQEKFKSEPLVAARIRGANEGNSEAAERQEETLERAAPPDLGKPAFENNHLRY